MIERNELKELSEEIREQALFLKELGISGLAVNLPAFSPIPAKQVRSAPEVEFRPRTTELREPLTRPSEQKIADPTLTSLPSLRGRLEPRKVIEPKDAEPLKVESEPKVIERSVAIPAEAAFIWPEPVETIEQIRGDIGPDCTRCKLCRLGRTQVVNSVGNFNADLMFVGEAPGADEDRLGEPFVGRAGQLLTRIIESIGFKRENVFIGNINRCRPPENRMPEPDESAACKPFLLREIAVIRPKVIVVLGAHAAQNLLETKVPIGKLRGRFHDLMGAKVMPTFHPAYLLRDPNKKREVWEDMKLVRDCLQGRASGSQA
ncbi:MAG: uracil-DNA glycosylase [Chloracidobacterium sp.]|nr:uracil-DNA glycosylase [Chloracidobacterium sp.]MCO5333071.1 uracil-DNA glycosylase [Pyrinomonadaceae bacterium]